MPRDNTMTVSLPSAMLEEVDAVRKKEHRTRSELVREALRVYLGKRTLSVHTPTPRELEAIRNGREEIRRGEYVTIDQLFQHLDVDRHRQKERAKSSKARPTTPTRATARRA